MKALHYVLATVLTLPLDVSSAELDEAWVSALRTRDLSALERLLAQGADVDASTEEGVTALMLCASNGRTRMVRRLFQAGAAVNAENRRGGTALMYAVTNRHPDIVELLLIHGASVDAKGANGWTALTIASVKGYDKIASLLLEHGADANVPDIYGWTPLMRAVYENRQGIVDILLRKGSVEINARDNHGATALHHAAAKGYAKIARALIAQGADPESKDSEGRTPLMVTSTAGHVEFMKLLRRPGTQ